MWPAINYLIQYCSNNNFNCDFQRIIMLNLVISTIGEAISVLSVSTCNIFIIFAIVLPLNLDPPWEILGVTIHTLALCLRSPDRIPNEMITAINYLGGCLDSCEEATEPWCLLMRLQQFCSWGNISFSVSDSSDLVLMSAVQLKLICFDVAMLAQLQCVCNFIILVLVFNSEQAVFFEILEFLNCFIITWVKSQYRCYVMFIPIEHLLIPYWHAWSTLAHHYWPIRLLQNQTANFCSDPVLSHLTHALYVLILLVSTFFSVEWWCLWDWVCGCWIWSSIFW